MNDAETGVKLVINPPGLSHDAATDGSHEMNCYWYWPVAVWQLVLLDVLMASGLERAFDADGEPGAGEDRRDKCDQAGSGC
jgi:hypothetical protein